MSHALFLNIVFFLYPFFLFMGIALQGTGYYLFGIFLPLLLLHKTGVKLHHLRPFAIGLISLHAIFYIANGLGLFHSFYASLGDLQTDAQALKSNLGFSLKLFTSRFSSSFAIGGIILLLGSYLKSSRLPTPQARQPMTFFLLGLFPAMLIFTSYLIFQNATGFDYRYPNHQLTPDNLLENGRYRVYGLHGHPLTIAGMGLALFTFLWTIFCQWISTPSARKNFFLPFANSYKFALFLSPMIFCSALMVILAGARTATGLLFVFLLGLPILLIGRKKPLFTLVFSLLTFFVGFGAAYKLGTVGRMLEAFKHMSNGMGSANGDNRLIFWKTHWQIFQDSPFIGQGGYWLEHGIRDLYYQALGYGDLRDKFNAHNLYLEILSNTGIFGVVALSLVVLYLARYFNQIVFKDQHIRFFKIPFIFALIANALHGFTQNVLFDASVTYIYLALSIVLVWTSLTTKNTLKDT